MSGAIRQLLREKFAPPAYALFEEVKNQTGYQKRSERYADALALSLWPSRGIGMTGFEIKVSRADWKKELDDPAKAAEFSKYCTGWYVVAPEGIVERLELPAAWGLIEVPISGRKRLVTKVEAPKTVPTPWDQSFVAALLRRQNEQTAALVDQALRARLEGEREKQKEEHVATLQRSQQAEQMYRNQFESLLQRLGLKAYEADSLELQLALDRLKVELEEVKAEQALIYRLETVPGVLKQLIAGSQGAIDSLGELAAITEQARRARQEFHRRKRAGETT